ncbi:MAG: hypothetical protein ACQBVK_00765 [Candidatus Phytoplasma sp. TWB_XP]
MKLDNNKINDNIDLNLKQHLDKKYKKNTWRQIIENKNSMVTKTLSVVTDKTPFVNVAEAVKATVKELLEEEAKKQVPQNTNKQAKVVAEAMKTLDSGNKFEKTLEEEVQTAKETVENKVSVYQTQGTLIEGDNTFPTAVTTTKKDGVVTKEVVTLTKNGVKTTTTNEPLLNKVTVQTFGADGTTVVKTEVTDTHSCQN